MIENTEELQGQLIASGNVVASMVATKGSKGDTGEPGQDGFSPIVETSKVGKVTTISITDAEGTTTATINDGEDGETGQPGDDGYSPSATVSKVGKIATITITDKDGTTTAEIRDGEDGLGSGDMLKSTYDTDNNGIVDNAEKVNNHTVLSDVPADAVFTDTTYTAGTNVSISAGNVISATDTTYTAGTGISISAENVISNTQTSAAWGNITGTLSNQTDLKNTLDTKVDILASRLSDATVGTSANPYILDEMTPGYYFVDTPSGTNYKYFKLTSSLTSTLRINNTSGQGYGFYLYIPKEINYASLTEGDTLFYIDKTTTSSSGPVSKATTCYVYATDNNSKIATDTTKSYNFSYGTSVASGAQTWNGVKTFNDVPVCATAPTNNSDLANKKYIDDGLSAKQDALVSGTNIKTINSTSLLGSGNIDVGASIPVQDTAPLNPSEDDLWIDTSESSGGTNILDTIFPIGSIVIKADNNNYSNWLGFTWERTLVGRVAVGIDSTQTEFDTIGETGGSKTRQLTVPNLPPHNHAYGYSIKTFYGSGTGVNTIPNVYTGGSTSENYVQETGGTSGTSTASSQAFSIMNPYQVVAYWKRTA